MESLQTEGMETCTRVIKSQNVSTLRVLSDSSQMLQRPNSMPWRPSWPLPLHSASPLSSSNALCPALSSPLHTCCSLTRSAASPLCHSHSTAPSELSLTSLPQGRLPNSPASIALQAPPLPVPAILLGDSAYPSPPLAPHCPDSLTSSDLSHCPLSHTMDLVFRNLLSVQFSAPTLHPVLAPSLHQGCSGFPFPAI